MAMKGTPVHARSCRRWWRCLGLCLRGGSVARRVLFEDLEHVLHIFAYLNQNCAEIRRRASSPHAAASEGFGQPQVITCMHIAGNSRDALAGATRKHARFSA